MRRYAKEWIPAAYQSDGVEWLVKRPAAALFWDPGLRKTSTALKAFCTLQAKGAAHKALVIAPKKVAGRVWSTDGEIGEWEAFEHLRSVFLHGRHKDRLVREDADIYTINPEGLKWLVESGGLRALFANGVDVLVVDELSKFKDARTQRFKLLKKSLGRFRWRWGLTGSPASNGLMDLFGQVYMLDRGVALGQYITHYRNTYFVPDRYGYDWTLQDGAEAKIYERIRNIASSKRAEDHLDLPKLITQDLWVDLPAKARKTYDAMENDLLAAVDGGLVTAANAAVASGKCRQIASGGLYQEADVDYETFAKRGPRRTLHVHDEKSEVLADIIGELQGSPALVLYEFHHDLDRIRSAIGKDVPVINGATSEKKAGRILDAWDRGDLPVLVGHPAAMGHGLNLQSGGAHHMIWYSLTWSYEQYDQAVRRLYRSGQEHRVIVYRILARGTVDEIVSRVLVSKGRRQGQLLDELRSYTDKRKRKGG